MAEWNPWQEMHRLRHDIDRAFAQVGWCNGGRNGHTFPTAFLPGRAARAYPLINVSEDAMRCLSQPWPLALIQWPSS